MITIEEFCKRHHACAEGMKWAVNNCSDMKQVWNTAKPEWLIWIATQDGVLTGKELRLFVVWSTRKVQHLMSDHRSIDSLDVAERYANGAATESELASASAEAWDAVSVAVRDAERAAASAIFTARSAATRAEARSAVSVAVMAAVVRDAVRAAAWASTNDAAMDAALAARDAARAAARAAETDARAAAMDAAKYIQARYLRFNCKPIFESNN
jgi:hypothetical protein